VSLYHSCPLGYSPVHLQVVSVDLCARASFDTILSAYRVDSKGKAKRVACNDDACGVQSKIGSLSLKGAPLLHL